MKFSPDGEFFATAGKVSIFQLFFVCFFLLTKQLLHEYWLVCLFVLIFVLVSIFCDLCIYLFTFNERRIWGKNNFPRQEGLIKYSLCHILKYSLILTKNGKHIGICIPT